MATKNTAIILGATGNLSFALGVVLQGLKKYNAPLLAEADVIIYYQNMDESTRKALNNILPCQFIAYQFPHMEGMPPHVLRDYGEMAFARYECFRYLKKYRYVLWLDADTLIRGDISPMRTYVTHGIGFRREYHDERVRVNFTQDIPGYNMQAPHFNSGVICMSQALTQDKDELSDWCYQKTAQLGPHLYYPDQGILLLLCQHYGLTIDVLPEKYNCEAQRNYWALRKAVVVHAIGHRKFWKYYYFDTWYRFYKHWVQQTGLPCENRFALLKKWGLLKYPLFQVAPDPAKHPIKFVTYLLRFVLRAMN